ncbi:S-layer homology domain-containing protein [Brevibacillus parabrevis]|uniref:S-layer homology domain-containing protein n=1 Tax=Brevibacillus parabrevis TaxID=54914 RepID=UPI001F6039AC|nr:S-layer homology domain-containing protein [Brevibacillus parabrevis]MDR4998343.1 S-layer homology domain-containing protein [Brevibacillus parabrevis]
MMKRFALCFLMAWLLVQAVWTNGANAAAGFDDIDGHWAEQQINELASLGIIKSNGKHLFYPNKPISRGEALALLNRVVEKVYGSLDLPQRKENLDYNFLLRGEVEQLLVNMKTVWQVETNALSTYDPGDRMLYYLYLAESGQLIKKQQKENPKWWLSSAALQQSLSREEASLLLFHVLAPQKFRTANLKPQDAATYFDSFYEWKQDRYYRDTYSPYPLAIREFQLFLTEKTFSPDKVMTRAEYAVVMKRLLDYYRIDTLAQFRAAINQQQKIAQLYLRSANLAWEKKDQARLSVVFSPDALKSMATLPQVPKYNGPVTITSKVDINDPKILWLIGFYPDPVKGDFQIEYKLEQADANAFGRKITAVIYSEK